MKIGAGFHKYIIEVTPFSSMLVKLLSKKAFNDTRATASHLGENLINLGDYISTVEFKIYIFDQYVKVNVEVFKERGYSTDYLMTNLFKSYHVVLDTYFVRYIKPIRIVRTTGKTSHQKK